MSEPYTTFSSHVDRYYIEGVEVILEQKRRQGRNYTRSAAIRDGLDLLFKQQGITGELIAQRLKK